MEGPAWPWQCLCPCCWEGPGQAARPAARHQAPHSLGPHAARHPVRPRELSVTHLEASPLQMEPRAAPPIPAPGAGARRPHSTEGPPRGRESCSHRPHALGVGHSFPPRPFTHGASRRPSSTSVKPQRGFCHGNKAHAPCTPRPLPISHVISHLVSSRHICKNDCHLRGGKESETQSGAKLIFDDFLSLAHLPSLPPGCQVQN